MSVLDDLRGDGPLARAIPRARLQLPEVFLVGPGVAVGLAPLVGLLGVQPVGPAWRWVLTGWLVMLVGRLGRDHLRLGWPVPALLRALEYGAVLLLVDASPWAYALAATLAFHHYDIVYRGRTRRQPVPRWLVAVTGGWELRTLALTLGAAFDVAGLVAATMTVLLAPVVAAEAVSAWAVIRPVADRR